MNIAQARVESLVSGPWIAGGEPRPGRIARADIRTRADIAAIEQYGFDRLLAAGTILESIEHAASPDPDKVAIKHLVSADPAVAPREITYRQLVGRLRAAASLFEEASQGEKPAVAVILPMLPEALIAGWGASSVGVGCQINPFLEMKHITGIMNAARATVLVTTTNAYGPGAWDKLGEVMAEVPTLKRVFIVGGDDPAKDFAKALEAQARKGSPFTPVTDPNAEAIYLPTGGTTAAPKLVRMTHKGQLINAWINGALGGSTPDGVVGHAMPNFHVGGFVVLALRALILRADAAHPDHGRLPQSKSGRQFLGHCAPARHDGGACHAGHRGGAAGLAGRFGGRPSHPHVPLRRFDYPGGARQRLPREIRHMAA